MVGEVFEKMNEFAKKRDVSLLEINHRKYFMLKNVKSFSPKDNIVLKTMFTIRKGFELKKFGFQMISMSP